MKNRQDGKKGLDKNEQEKLKQAEQDHELLEGEGEDSGFPIAKDIETPEEHFPNAENDKPEDAHTLTGGDDLPPTDNEDTFSKKERR